ncbi:MAG TPA: VanZ family protein [Patescibacteria group bacterium]|nr:VanZ family protein [Patescibacteria group bacterium]
MALGSRETTELLNRIQEDTQSPVPSNWLDPLAGWLTLAALLAIFVLALFPFNFSAQATALRREGFFLDWFAPVSKHWMGWLLNVLFFVPIGFGWAWWARVKQWRRPGGWVAVVLGGLVLSLTVETLQLYIPTRDSSWDDVLTNTLGALAGWLFFRCCGAQVLRFVESAIEDLSAALER